MPGTFQLTFSELVEREVDLMFVDSSLSHPDDKLRHKKNCFFTFCQKTETPPPPPFLTTSVFSDKDFFYSGQTPLFLVKNGKKLPIFLCKTLIFFWQIMQ